jgi:hypothetical protein
MDALSTGCLETERVELDNIGYSPLLPKGIQILYRLCSTSHSREQNIQVCRRFHTSIDKIPKGVAEIERSVVNDWGVHSSVFRKSSGRWLVHRRSCRSSLSLALAEKSNADCLFQHRHQQVGFHPLLLTVIYSRQVNQIDNSNST